MNRSESIVKIAAAFVAAQSEIGAALKGEKNLFLKSNYADLGDVLDACKGPLNKNGLSILQPVITTDDGRTWIETWLMHESGEYFYSTALVVVKEANNAQAIGAAETYVRRQMLQSLVGVAAEDDDGNSNSAVKSAVQAQKTPVQGQQAARPQSNAQHPAPLPSRTKNTQFPVPQPPQAQQTKEAAPVCIVFKNGETLNQMQTCIFVEAFIKDRDIRDNQGNLVSWELWVASYLQLKKVSEATALLAKGPLTQPQLEKVWNGYLSRKAQEDEKEEKTKKEPATA